MWPLDPVQSTLRLLLLALWIEQGRGHRRDECCEAGQWLLCALSTVYTQRLIVHVNCKQACGAFAVTASLSRTERQAGVERASAALTPTFVKGGRVRGAAVLLVPIAMLRTSDEATGAC